MTIRATVGKTMANGWGNQTTVEPVYETEALEREREREREGERERGEVGGKVGKVGEILDGLLGAGHLNVTADLPYCTVEYGALLFALPLEQTVRPWHNASVYGYALHCDAATMTVIKQPPGKTQY